MTKRRPGRPKEYTEDKMGELVERFREYIDTTDIPIIAEFAYQNDIDRTLLYDNEQFSTLRKKCIAKKEANLERGALLGQVNPTVAIFSLKQLGWKDRQEKVVYVDPKTLSDDELEELIKNGQ